MSPRIDWVLQSAGKLPPSTLQTRKPFLEWLPRGDLPLLSFT
jgi:hypothetical protein